MCLHPDSQTGEKVVTVTPACRRRGLSNASSLLAAHSQHTPLEKQCGVKRPRQGGVTEQVSSEVTSVNEKDEPEDPNAFKLLERCLLGQFAPEYIVWIECLSPSEITEAPKERT